LPKELCQAVAAVAFYRWQVLKVSLSSQRQTHFSRVEIKNSPASLISWQLWGQMACQSKNFLIEIVLPCGKA